MLACLMTNGRWCESFLDLLHKDVLHEILHVLLPVQLNRMQMTSKKPGGHVFNVVESEMKRTCLEEIHKHTHWALRFARKELNVYYSCYICLQSSADFICSTYWASG